MSKEATISSIERFISEGLTIRKIDGGFSVFTVPTQHFTIHSLSELTEERLEEEKRGDDTRLIEGLRAKLMFPE